MSILLLPIHLIVAIADWFGVNPFRRTSYPIPDDIAGEPLV